MNSINNKDIYTSYFAKMKSNKLILDHIAVNITAGPPKGIQDMMEFDEVKPSYNLLIGYKKGKINKAGYTEIYNNILNNREEDIKIRMNELLSKGIPIIFYCYEKSDSFCHRHLLAAKLKDIGFNMRGEF